MTRAKPYSTLITGRACRLPGAATADAFADSLYAGRDLVTEIPETRWAHAAFLHPQPGVRGKSYTFAAGVLDDIWDFDPSVFNISVREAAQMDPQQRILLQVVWEALEDAGLPHHRLAGTDVGVFVGASAMGYGTRISHDPLVADAYMMMGNTLSLVSNRISHALDLRGPSLTVDTACSSSMFALHLAQQALLRDEIDTAIVAGVNILLDPSHFVGFSAARMLSPTGRCRPFSARADGYVRSEGAVAFVLERKPLAAIAPRRAYAAILGVGTNNDGHTVNVALPSLEGQSRLLREVYETCEVDPASLAFVEAHGTGTQAGDPIEARALGETLGQKRSSPLPIGSVKSNIGHLEPASGVAGILKSLIALERNSYPATLHAEDANPNIPFEELNLSPVPATLTFGQAGERARRAGVSSFGFGGANAHVILEHVDTASPAALCLPRAPEPAILVTSAASPESRAALMQAWSARLSADGVTTASLAEDAAEVRSFRPLLACRAAVLGEDVPRAAQALAQAVHGQSNPRIFMANSRLCDAPPVFLYSGNGSQYAGMGLAALASDPAYAEALQRIDRIFEGMSGWSIIAAMNRTTLQQDLRDCAVAQPLLFADQIALTEALAARGLVSVAVMGHSGGEVAAAHASGALDLQQALRLIHRRSLSQTSLRGRGAMAALSVSVDEASESLAVWGGSVTIAAENSPRSVTLVGPPQEIDAYIIHAKREKRWACVKLAIDYPYHGPAQDEVLGELARSIAGLTVGPSRIPFHSSVEGRMIPGEALTVDYWCANVRKPVRFRDAMASLKAAGHKSYLEIGPSAVLENYVKACLGTDAEGAVIISSFEKQDTAEVNPVRRTLARAMVNGFDLQAGPLLPSPARFDRSLPRYPWHNQPYRVDTTPPIEAYYGSGADYHPLLGIEDGEGLDKWHVDLGALPEMEDHRVGDQALFPAMGFAEIALLAAQRALKTDRVELRDLDVLAPLVLTLGHLSTLRTTALVAQSVVSIEGRSRGTYGAWRDHLRGRFFRAPTLPGSRVTPDVAPGIREDIGGNAIYAAAREIGLNYGPRFRRVTRVRWLAADRLAVFLSPSAPTKARGYGFALDLIGADAVCHGMIAVALDGKIGAERRGYVPVRIGRLILSQPGVAIAAGEIHVCRVGRRSILADFTLFDAEGTEIARMEGVRFQVANRLRGLNLALHSFRTLAVPVSEVQDPPPLVLGDVLRLSRGATLSSEDDGHLLIDALAQRVAHEAVVTLADAGGHIAPVGEDGLPRSAYAVSVLSLLERADLIRRDGGGWQLIPAEEGMPASADLLQGLLSERPDLGPELALLARLTVALPDLLTSAEIDAEAVFGKGALNNHSEGSVLAYRRRALLMATVQGLAAAWPKGRLAIAEVTDGQAQLLPGLLTLPETVEASFWEVQTDCHGKPGATVALPPDRVTIATATIEGLSVTPPFDLVLLPGTLARSRDPAGLMQLLAEKLAPGGRIIAIDPRPSDFLDLVEGLNAEWFVDVTPPRGPVSRLMSPDELARLALGAGLEAVEAECLPDGMGGASVLLARRAKAACRPAVGTPQLRAAVCAAVTRGAHPGLVKHEAAGVRLVRPEGQDRATVMWFDPKPSADPVGRLSARLLVLRDLLQAAEGNQGRIIAIIPGGSGQAQAGPASPEQAAVWSALRTAGNEYPKQRWLCIDPHPDLRGTKLAGSIAALVAARLGETEVVLTAHSAYGLRVVRGLPAATPAAGENRRSVLTAPVWSGLNEIVWQSTPRRPPCPGEIEVEVAASGLNYRDVMWTIGLLPEEALEKGFAGATIGIECSGRVVAVGDGVTDLALGDEVVTFGPSSFASHVTVAADLAACMPRGTDLVAAATVPVAFSTAYYALEHLARLTEGETVLIHGGAGGVGLAAIQIAQARGARVIATAGSLVKRAVLSCIGVDHVLDSRSLAFADQVLQLTGRRGADVVINALAGRGMEESLFCTAPFGRFIELGKQDFYANTAVGLRPMKDNISYFGVDVDQLITARPALFRNLFRDVMAGFARGDFRPLPFRAFSGEAAVDAFRLMQKSEHLGKVILRPRAPRGLHEDRTQALFAANPDGAHLVVGGLGGLGIEVAEWLVQRGARALVLIGRSAAPDPAAAARIAEWRARGVTVDLAACDVADGAELAALLDRVRAQRPLSGVIHSAMLLDDTPMQGLTEENLRRSLSAKVAGGAALDSLTRGDRLDYFVLFSSIAALIGNHGQSAYVAANAYLEGIARARRSAGRPGLALGWGPISDVGYLKREAGKAALVNRMLGNVNMTARDVTSALDRLLVPDASTEPVLYITPMRWTASVTALKTLSEPSFQLLRNLGQREGDGGSTEDLRETLRSLSRAKAEERLAGFLVGRIAHILHLSETAISTTRPITELGMDSLMGVELGLALQETLGDDAPVTSVSDGLSIAQISARIVENLQGGSDADLGIEGADPANLMLITQHLH